MMALDSSKQSKKKRKRNTTDEQYETYLQEMESDYSFRSGTINPTQEENYLKNKWEPLCNKLNSVASGPELTVEDWKKRFKDWKNSTRVKYRKLRERRMQTGGGPPPEITLTPFEDRGLAVWGKVAVEGCSINIQGGLPPENHNVAIYPENIIVSEEHGEECDVANKIINEKNNGEASNTTVVENFQKKKLLRNNVSRKNTNIVNKTSTIKKCKNKNKRPVLNDIAVNLMNSYDKSIDTNASIVEALNNMASVYKTIQEKRLQFEITKFKFENPSFEI